MNHVSLTNGLKQKGSEHQPCIYHPAIKRGLLEIPRFSSTNFPALPRLTPEIPSNSTLICGDRASSLSRSRAFLPQSRCGNTSAIGTIGSTEKYVTSSSKLLIP